MTDTHKADPTREDTEESLTRLHEPTQFFKPNGLRRTGLWHNHPSPTRRIPYLSALEPLNPEAVYTIAGVVPNEEAIAHLDQESPRLTQLRYGASESMGGDTVRFSKGLMQVYVHMMEKELKRRRIKHVHYDLVDGGWDYSWSTRRYPTIFVMEGKRSLDDKFDAVTESMHDKRIHAALLKAQEPQNYDKGPIETLHEAGILPLIRSPDITAHLTGAELKTFIDLLLPWKIEKKHDCRNTIYVD